MQQPPLSALAYSSWHCWALAAYKTTKKMACLFFGMHARCFHPCLVQNAKQPSKMRWPSRIIVQCKCFECAALIACE
eukprot:1161182-Pelagomonas_calceolata.AAC.13